MRAWLTMMCGMLALSGLLCSTACRHAPTHGALSGRASYRFVEPAAAAAEVVAAGETEPMGGDYFREARSIEPLAQPIYPAVALQAGVGAVTVGVRVTVDANGRVSEVGPSLLAVSTPSRFAKEFEQAVEEAVRQWRFRPAQRYHVTTSRGEDGRARYQVSEEHNTETWFDLSFTFTALGQISSTHLQ